MKGGVGSKMFFVAKRGKFVLEKLFTQKRGTNYRSKMSICENKVMGVRFRNT